VVMSLLLSGNTNPVFHYQPALRQLPAQWPKVNGW
jgi:hypothetical protein